jgi:protein SCO1/2
MPLLRLLPIACSLLLAALFATAAAAHEPAKAGLDRPAALEASRAAVGKQVGDYALTDRFGRPLRIAGYRGRPLVVSLVYTACSDVCPVTTRNLAGAVREAQRVLGPGTFATLTVGYNPPSDYPVAMSDFARRNAIALPDWEFASGEAASVTALARDLGFSYVATGGGFDHIAQTTIVDSAGRVYRQVYGEEPEARQIVEPLRELLAGAQAPALALAPVFEKIRLWCTVYDPASGRYRLDYALFIEILTGLTVIGGVALFLYRGRARA